MENTISIAIDDYTQQSAELLFEDLGLDLSTAIRMFLKQCIREQSLPFVPAADVGLTSGQIVLRRACAESRKNGTDEMTMDEINAMIAEVRAEARNKTDAE
jgi:DNA-damage-inducible protein J